MSSVAYIHFEPTIQYRVRQTFVAGGILTNQERDLGTMSVFSGGTVRWRQGPDAVIRKDLENILEGMAEIVKANPTVPAIITLEKPVKPKK